MWLAARMHAHLCRSRRLANHPARDWQATKDADGRPHVHVRWRAPLGGDLSATARTGEALQERAA